MDFISGADRFKADQAAESPSDRARGPPELLIRWAVARGGRGGRAHSAAAGAGGVKPFIGVVGCY